MHSLEDVFGPSGRDLALMDQSDPQTGPRTYATTDATRTAPESALRALVNPSHSAIFWVGAAAVLGLILVTGQLHVEAALGGRAGRK